MHATSVRASPPRTPSSIIESRRRASPRSAILACSPSVTIFQADHQNSANGSDYADDEKRLDQQRVRPNGMRTVVKLSTSIKAISNWLRAGSMPSAKCQRPRSCHRRSAATTRVPTAVRMGDCDRSWHGPRSRDGQAPETMNLAGSRINGAKRAPLRRDHGRRPKAKRRPLRSLRSRALPAE